MSVGLFHLQLREDQFSFSLADSARANQVIEQFVGDLRASGAPPNPSIYFNYSPIPYFNFGIRYYLATGRFPAGMAMPISTDPQTIEKGVQTSDYVVVCELGKPNGSDGYWEALIRSTGAIIVGLGNLTEVDRMSFAGGSYVLYRVDKPAVTSHRAHT